MRVLTVGVLCGVLLLSGCTRRQVNEVSVFEYEAGDNAFQVALKTTGNLVPWIGGAVVVAVLAAPELAIQAAAGYAQSRK